MGTITITNLIGGNITITTKPVANPKTKITFTDGNSQEYDWSGEINYKTMTGAGLAEKNAWIKQPQTVEIGTNVTSIGDYAFENCKSLTSVTIPDSVTSIGAMAFMDCDNLTSVTIPDSVTRIDTEAFKWCEGLASVTIGNGVTSVGYRVFNGCIKLTSVTFSGKDKATVTGIIETYNWYFNPGCVIHCTDGDITIEAKS